MQHYTRAQQILIALFVLAGILAVLLLYAVVTQKSPESVAVSEKWENSFRESPRGISQLIPIIFDYQNQNIAYDWTTARTLSGDEQLVEIASFTLSGQPYDFVLSTFKESPGDAEYTIADYLSLTLDVVNASGGVDEITYTDLGADGVVDAVHLNDVLLRDSALQAAQDQYTNELLILESYLFGN